MNLYIKKIWSLNPTLYKFIKYEKAIDSYSEWLDVVIQSQNFLKPDTHIKTFEEWCKTEI